MTTLHILSCPYSPVHINNRVDPFSIAVVKFIKNMTQLGWNCIHYGIEGSEVSCLTINCLPTVYNDRSICITEYNENASKEISARKKPNDIILCFYGIENKGATQNNQDLFIVEPSIGYDTTAVFAPYRVFTSYAQMHFYYGQNNMLMNPSWNDAVIYNTMSPDEFTYNEHKEDYFLYFGRVIENKGIHVAIQATSATGKRLVVAGPGSLKDLGYDTIPPHVEVVGVADVVQRKELMRKARAIIGPTYYVEPFGNMVTEGYLSGTPAITTDWGGFTETVVQGKTGFRCREFREFVDAINNIDKIKSYDCWLWAIENCSETVVHNKYDRYFKKILERNFYR